MTAPPPATVPGSDPAAVLARVVDFSTAKEAWPRRLWDFGAVLSLKELRESCSWVAEGALRQPSVDWQKARLQPRLGPDAGLGAGPLRRELIELLKGPLVAPSSQWRRLADLIEMAELGYLDRHAAALDARGSTSVERLARILAAHLLDAGLSMPAVRRWAVGHVGGAATTSDLLRDAQALADRGPRQFEVLLPCSRIPHRQTLAEGVPSFRPRSQALRWLTEHGHAPLTELDGAFCFTVEARDPLAAADQARELAERLLARDAFGADRKNLQLADTVYAEGVEAPLPLTRPSRHGRIPSLHHEAQLYTVTAERGRLDAALELAAPLNHGPIAPAVSGAWAAVESLLFSAADAETDERGRVVVASRLARLVACSWPRAELTALSYRLALGLDTALDERLERAGSNQERAAVLERALVAGTPARPAAGGRHASDACALQRMRLLAADPLTGLKEAADVFEVAFRRLYRSRNVIAHAGATAALSHDATLRVTAPLVGAGLDRVAHAYLVRGVDPLALAAQAENSLLLVGADPGRGLTTLLE